MEEATYVCLAMECKDVKLLQKGKLMGSSPNVYVELYTMRGARVNVSEVLNVLGEGTGSA
jgi:hypothetical protein